MRDLYYLRDRDGVVLLCKGDHHPPGKNYAHPVYWPDSEGDRFHPLLGRYRKETSDSDNSRYLHLHPESQNSTLPTIPLVSTDDIVEIYQPLESYQALRDSLQGVWQELALELERRVGAERIGVFGSSMVGLNKGEDGRQVKDVDFVCYGYRSRDTLKTQISDFRAVLGATEISGDHIAWHVKKFGRGLPQGLTSWERLLSRKWNSLQLAPGLLATIRFSYLPEEIPSDPLQLPSSGLITVSGTVIDDGDVEFMPRSFTLQTDDGESYRVSSYFWGMQSCVREGDQVRVQGDLHGGRIIALTGPNHGILLLDG